jgi:hypothetical protein
VRAIPFAGRVSSSETKSNRQQITVEQTHEHINYANDKLIPQGFQANAIIQTANNPPACKQLPPTRRGRLQV